MRSEILVRDVTPRQRWHQKPPSLGTDERRGVAWVPNSGLCHSRRSCRRGRSPGTVPSAVAEGEDESHRRRDGG